MAGIYGPPGAPAPRLVTLDRNIGAERVIIQPLSEWEELASGILTNCPTVMKVLAQVCLCFVKIQRMERSGTEAIRPHIKPSKLKREISNITKSQNTKENILSTELAAIS